MRVCQVDSLLVHCFDETGSQTYLLLQNFDGLLQYLGFNASQGSRIGSVSMFDVTRSRLTIAFLMDWQRQGVQLLLQSLIYDHVDPQPEDIAESVIRDERFECARLICHVLI